jgi:6-phosphofructokinase 1
MPEVLRGQALVAQSGGPTTVINASACGVIQEAQRQPRITGILGANNGILGVLEEDLFDLGVESPQTIEGLRSTPSSAIGSCRYKLGQLDKDRGKYERLLDVFKSHDIRYFFYIGGNDSMDTADKVNRLAVELGHELRVLGVPKTIDNDLGFTDHCPGYGSVAKYLATATMEAGRDTEAMHTFDPVTIMEAMGRNTGWIAAACGLAQRTPEDAPHLVYVPEIPFSRDRFLGDLEAVLRRGKGACIVVSEGLKDEKGEYLKAEKGEFGADLFGHKQLGGVAEYLKELVEQRLRVKCRFNKLGTCQRNAMHLASKTDNDEAYVCGQEAVRQAVAGVTGMMITLDRVSQHPYRCQTGLAKLHEVANSVKPLPREYMNAAGNHVTPALREYVTPLIQGEAPLRMGADGLPEFVRFQRQAVPKQLPAWKAT